MNILWCHCEVVYNQYHLWFVGSNGTGMDTMFRSVVPSTQHHWLFVRPVAWTYCDTIVKLSITTSTICDLWGPMALAWIQCSSQLSLVPSIADYLWGQWVAWTYCDTIVKLSITTSTICDLWGPMALAWIQCSGKLSLVPSITDYLWGQWHEHTVIPLWSCL